MQKHAVCKAKKKPTVVKLWVFILVVVAGFEPATSAL
jgi:hypothetical protein